MHRNATEKWGAETLREGDAGRVLIKIRRGVADWCPSGKPHFWIPAFAHARQLKRISMYFKVLTKTVRATRRHPRMLLAGVQGIERIWIPA